MTGTIDKIRAVMLVTVIVISIFGVSVAFSSSAAAATNGSVDIPSGSVDAETTQTFEHSAELDFSGGPNLQHFQIDFSVDAQEDPDLSSVSEDDLTVDGTGINTRDDTADFTQVKTPNSGVLSFKLEDSADGISDGDTVTVTVNGVTTQSVSSNKEFNFNVSYRDTGDQQFDSSEVSNGYSIDVSTDGPPGIDRVNVLPNDYTGTTKALEDSTDDGSDNVFASGAETSDISFNGDETLIEVVFNESIRDLANSESPENGDFTVNLSDGTSTTPDTILDKGGNDDGHIILVLDNTNPADVENLNVTTGADFQDSDGNAILPSGNQGVEPNSVATTVLVDSGSEFSPGTGVKQSIEGETVALLTNPFDNLDDSVDIKTAAGSFILSGGSTGSNSAVIGFDTTDRNKSATFQFVASNTQQFELLNLSASADSTAITDAKNLTGTVSANDGNRDVDVKLIDSNDNTVTTNAIILGGSGEGTFDFGTRDADTYSITVIDVNTSATVATSDVIVKPLGLSASADSTDITDADDLTGTVSANDGNRDVDVELSDSSDNTVTTQTVTLDGSGGGTFNFGTRDADTYSIEATDANTSATVATSDITVRSPTSGLPSVLSATEFSDASIQGSTHLASVIEVAFDEAILSADTDTGLSIGEIEITLDGEDISERYTLDQDGSVTGQLVLSSPTDIPADADIDVSFTVDIRDTATDDNSITAENVSATVTGATQATSGSSDEVTTVDQTVFAGTQLAVVANTDSDRNRDFEITTSSAEFVFDGSTGRASELFVFDTSERDTAVRQEFSFDNETDFGIGLRSLGLSASVDSTDITDGENLTGDISINTGDRVVDVKLVDSDDNTVATRTLTLDGSGEGTFDFGTRDADAYSITVTDIDTGVTVATSDVTVTSTAAGEAALAADSGVVTTEQGDFANVTVELIGQAAGGEAELVIGDESDSGYQANVTVDDGNDDGEVTVRFNTYAAGSTGNGTVVEAAGATADTVTFDDATDQSSLTGIMETGDYELLVSTGNASATLDDPDEVGALVVNERSIGDQLLWTGPASLVEDISGEDTHAQQAAVIESAIADGKLTQTDTVAEGDAVVHLVDVSGLSGLVENHSANELFTSNGNGIVSDDSSLGLQVRQTTATTDQNEDPIRIDADILANASIVNDADDDRLLVAYEIAETSASAGDTFKSRFRVQDARLLNPDPDTGADLTNTETRNELYESNSATFGVEVRTAAFDENPFTLAAEATQTISGTTTVTPGTEFDLRVRSDADTQPAFTKTAEDVTVQADGSFSAEFDFSEQEAGDSYTVTIQQLDAGKPSADGTLVAANPANFAVSELNSKDVTVMTGTAVDVSATITNTGGQSTTQTVELRIGDTVLAEQRLTLDAGTSESVTFPSTDTGELEAGEYDYGVFTATDNQTTALTIEAAETETEAPSKTNTPTPTEMPTESEPETPASEPTPTEDKTPPLGALAVLIVLIAAVLVATRR